jgi:hypothetical protein
LKVETFIIISVGEGNTCGVVNVREIVVLFWCFHQVIDGALLIRIFYPTCILTYVGNLNG